MYQLFSKDYNKKTRRNILWTLKVPQTLRSLVVLRIQPHFQPMPKDDGLSRSEMAVKIADAL